MFKVLADIIEKEALAIFKDMKFLVSFVLMVVFCATAAVAFLCQYERQCRDFRQIQSETWREGAPASQLRIPREPNAFGFVTSGKDNIMPQYVQVEERLVDEAGGMVTPKTFLFTVDNIDWLFIVAVLTAMMALLHSYDAVSGERECGSLRLCLSYPVSRALLFTGKYLGIIIALALAMTAGMLVLVAVIVAAGGPLPITPDTVMRLALILLFSVLYVSAIVLLGLLVSMTVSQSPTALLIGLLVWVTITFVIPLGSVQMAELTRRPPPANQLTRQIETVYDKFAFVISSDTLAGIVHSGLSEAEKQVQIKALAAVMARERDQRFQQARIEVARAKNEYNKRIQAQTELARNIASASPIFLLESAFETLSRSGYTTYREFIRQVSAYEPEFSRYVADLEERYRRENPEVGPVSVSYYGYELALPRIIPADSLRLDPAGLRPFRAERTSFAGDLTAIVRPFGLLALINALLLVWGMIRFSRAEVS
jgi:ABC-type transport system involved in multi-copper enzyme maturation permease subunit